MKMTKDGRLREAVTIVLIPSFRWEKSLLDECPFGSEPPIAAEWGGEEGSWQLLTTIRQNISEAISCGPPSQLGLVLVWDEQVVYSGLDRAFRALGKQPREKPWNPLKELKELSYGVIPTDEFGQQFTSIDDLLTLGTLLALSKITYD